MDYPYDMDILKTLKNEISHSNESRYKIAQQTGVDPVVLHRLVHGGSCTVKTAEILLQHFGYELKKTAKKRQVKA